MNGEVIITFFHDVMEMEPGRTGNNTEITEPEIRLFTLFKVDQRDFPAYILKVENILT